MSLDGHGLVDLRYMYSQGRQSWLDDDLGKFRFGGQDNGRDYARLNEAALSLHARWGWIWSATATLKAAAAQFRDIDLTEGVVRLQPAPHGLLSFSARAGFFFPPVSMENTGTAWSSPYTLTASAINSWIGEEVRIFGTEAQVGYRSANGDRLTLFGAGFANNDTVGALIGFRGWAMHDYKATLGDRLPLPIRTGLQTSFPQQAALTAPFVEVDGRPGYYVGVSLERPGTTKLRALYYDNQARPTAIEAGQYAWHTRFWSAGVQLFLPWDSLLIAQWLHGRTQMGETIANRTAVDVTLWAYSLLLSKSLHTHRWSIRIDRFGTDEHDFLPAQDNRESGFAITGNYNYTWSQRHQFNIEVTHISSDRPGRRLTGKLPEQEETLWQVAYRLFF